MFRPSFNDIPWELSIFWSLCLWSVEAVCTLSLGVKRVLSRLPRQIFLAATEGRLKTVKISDTLDLFLMARAFLSIVM